LIRERREEKGGERRWGRRGSLEGKRREEPPNYKYGYGLGYGCST